MFKKEYCSSEEIENFKKVYNLKLNWWTESPEENECYKIIKDNEVVAMIEFGTYLIDGYKCIDNFEVFQKRKGIGRDIIEFLTSNKEEKYCLYSEDEANEFWK